MIVNDALGQVPPLPNPFVYRGNPSVGQIWTQFASDGKIQWFCLITKVDLYFMKVEYSVFPDNKYLFHHLVNEIPIHRFKDFWTFSH